MTNKYFDENVNEEKGIRSALKEGHLPTVEEIRSNPLVKKVLHDYVVEQIKVDKAAGYTIAFSDGSFKEGVPSYGAVIYLPDGEAEIQGNVTNEEHTKTQSYGGEVYGILKTLEKCIANEITKISLFTDSETAYKQYAGIYGANRKTSKYFFKELEKIRKELNEIDANAEIKITWCSRHLGVEQNKKADQLAGER